MAKYDLTWRVSEYFDKHLVFPLLEFMSYRNVYRIEDLANFKLEALQTTKMVDLIIDTWKEVNQSDDVPADLMRRRAETVEQWKFLQETTQPVVDILEKPEVTQRIAELRDRDGRQLMEYLVEKFDFKESMLEKLYDWAKFLFECGNYEGVVECLNFYRYLTPPHLPNYLNALWGKLASAILLQRWDEARDDVKKLHLYIDGHESWEGDLTQVSQRAWLMHWSLWVAFNHPQGCDDLIDLCLNNQQYVNVMSTVCPHMLRYVTAAVVTSRRRKAAMKDLVKIIDLESYQYSDPVTELLLCLYIKYDFDTAQEKLIECKQLLQNDFFLTGKVDEFIESARQLIFEMFCRIHQCITIKMLAQKLDMTNEEAERWIVNLIKNAQLDAKIDSKLGHVVMGSRTASIHEQIMESTKRLSFRAQQTAYNLEKVYREKHVRSGFGE